MIDEEQLRQMGLNPEGTKEDQKMVREAYEKAHHIREFEIQLYWTRSAYLWTLQGAAFAALAVIATTMNSIGAHCFEAAQQSDGECQVAKLRLMTICIIWAFGLFSSYVWLLLLRGAKFWQNNWERHVDLLEGAISGHLYKTYRVRDMRAPYSVSKLNEAMALFTLILWVLIGIGGGLIFLDPALWMIVLISFTLVCFFLIWFFDDHFRMSNFGINVAEQLHEDGKPEYVVSRRRRQSDKDTA